MGLVFIAAGIVPMLFGLGVITPPTPADGTPTPAWIGTGAGLMFVLAGLAVILDYGIAGGVGPDGDLKPGTPLAIRGINLLLGMSIVGLLTAISGWVAFGPGPRTFSSTIVLPFMWRHNPHASEMGGRIAFGFGTLLMALMFVLCGVVGVRRFMRAWREGV